jgi:rhodanese-related sulfurtransferase
MRYITLLVFIVSFSLACGTKQEHHEMENLSLNQVQFIGSHNSYKLPIQKELFEVLEAMDTDLAQSLDYSHPGIWEQLDLGLRVLELDVYDDPEGGRFLRPKGKELLMDSGFTDFSGMDTLAWQSPGLKVMHIQDIDYKAHHVKFEEYLSELKAWSEFHPKHLPIMISINAKDFGREDERFTPALPFDREALARIDEEIGKVFSQRELLLPRDVKGSSASLEAAILERGWPKLEDCLGKFYFVLDEGGEKMDSYISLDENFERQRMFVLQTTGKPQAGILFINDPEANIEQITEMVNKGYLVRTRADADTREARENDTVRREKAFVSGAQFISTDYYRPDPRWPAYHVDFGDNGYFRVNPVTAAGYSGHKLMEPESKGLVAVSPEALKWAAENKVGIVLDVRTAEEVAEGVIGEVAHINFMADSFEEEVLRLEKNQPVLVYCKVGGRSEKAANLMLDSGFERVYHLDGGIDKWKEQGHPVVPYNPPGKNFQ